MSLGLLVKVGIPWCAWVLGADGFEALGELRTFRATEFQAKNLASLNSIRSTAERDMTD